MSTVTERFWQVLRPIALLFVGVGLNLEPSVAHAAVHYQRLKSFGFPDLVEQTPGAAMIQCHDGALYGTTVGGGVSLNFGTVFKIAVNGTGYKTLYRFGTTNGDGQSPRAAIVQGRDGFLYGTTAGGGTAGMGTVFKLNTNGSGMQSLHSFGTTVGDGQKPTASLSEGSDGVLYGTTFIGGSSSNGTVFKLNRDGSGYQILHHFGGGSDGGFPASSLVEGTNGTLFGTASGLYENTLFYYGTAFKINKDGTGYGVLHTFTGDPNSGGADGAVPVAALTRGTDGRLYGTTMFGGNSYIGQSYGTVFRLNQDGTGYSVLVNFGLIGFEGTHPTAQLVEGSDGFLYGTTIDRGYVSGVVPTAFKVTKTGSAFTTLHRFSSYAGQGETPPSGVIQGSNGVLYGTVQAGGAHGTGFIFKLNRDGSSYANLRSFIGSSGGDAVNPATALVEGSDGALYGATVNSPFGTDPAPMLFKINKNGTGYRILRVLDSYYGSSDVPAAALTAGRDGVLYGANGLANPSIFKLNQDGSGYAVLHSFVGAGDGQQPLAALLEATDGALYGATLSGGSGGSGTVFKLNKNGTGYTILHNFNSYDGESPWAKLLEGPDEKLYGTTSGGGYSYPNNVGTVFKLNKDGSSFSILHYFTSSSGEGRSPRAALVLGTDGALYGTTDFGGTNDHGTVFKLNRDGTGYRVLFNFVSTGQFLPNPRMALLTANGKLYGTGQGGYDYGGTFYPGAVFRLNEDGTDYTVLHAFSNTDTGGWFVPVPILLSVDGTFYGITQYGGDLNFGTVFRLWPPETPDMLSVSNLAGIAQVRFAGSSNSQYQVLRSTDLSNWSMLTTITMPGAGAYTYSDNAPPSPAAFYRAAWVP